MLRRFTVSLVVVALAFCLLVSPVFADGLMVNRATYSTYATAESMTTGLGLGYFNGDDEYLVQVSFYLQDPGSASGSVKAVVWNYTDNTFVENSSNSVDLAGLDDGVFVWCNFSFANTSYLRSDTQYAFALWVSGGPTSNWVYGKAAGSTMLGWDVDHWNAGSAPAFMLKVYTTAVSGGGSYTPPVEPAGSSTTDLTISSLMWWFIYLVVMLAPAWFLGGYLKMGKWGFVIGLAVGSGIGYAFLSGFPLWLLILVAVGEAGLVYSTVSHEG